MQCQRLALGSAQFGLAYGINNKNGILSIPEMDKILNLAISSGIDTIDTAYGYGSSEEKLGECLNKRNKQFRVVTKLPDCNKSDLQRYLTASLTRLHMQKVYGYLFHSFSTYQRDPSIMDSLRKYKEEGIITKIGFSLYYPHELDVLLHQGIQFDLLQVPYSIFDQRFVKYFEMLKNLNIEIHARSVFLQGLAIKKPEELEGQFRPIKEKVMLLQTLSKSHNISITDLCLNFVKLNQNIDRIVVGVDNVSHMEQLLDSDKTLGVTQLNYAELETLREENENIIIPALWNLKKDDKL